MNDKNELTDEVYANVKQLSGELTVTVGVAANTINELADGLYLQREANVRLSLEDEATFFLHLKERYKELDDARKRIYAEMEFYNKSALPERMETEGLDLFRIPALGRSFSVNQKYSTSMVNKDKAMAWLREIESGDLISETVNASQLAALCRDLLIEQGVEPPADAVKLTAYKVIGINKYQPKSS